MTQSEHTFTHRDGVSELRYLLYAPPGYADDTRQRWPLIFFLHGAGERGSDLNLLKTQGLPRKLETQDLQFAVVSPQCPADVWWTDYQDVLMALLDDVISHYNLDATRVYLTGLSMGGFATWSLAIAHPHRFAAVAPICGGAVLDRICAIKDLPVWVFHGAKDDRVPLDRSGDAVDALRACGGNVRFTVYPDAGHDSWTETYANPALYEWFLKHRIRPTG